MKTAPQEQRPLPINVAPQPQAESDDDAVFDALAFAQAPCTVKQLAGLLAAAGRRTARGAGFHPPEVRRLLDGLAQGARVTHDERGRWRTEPAAGWARFRALVRDPASRERWWRAWRQAHDFDRAWRLEMFDVATYAGALRVVAHAGRSIEAINRLGKLVGPSSVAREAVREALLAPFDAQMLDDLDPALVVGLAGHLLATLGGDADSGIVPLLDWLLALATRAPASLPEHLRYRLAEGLLFDGRLDAARALLAAHASAEAQALRAAIAIAEGRYADGAAQFEAASKQISAETGKRKNLFPPSIGWLYAMALLAQAEPAAWGKARRFVAGEAGKREAQPYTFWGRWQAAIDQRLGDAPPDRAPFEVRPASVSHPLEQLHCLLLAAWLHLEPSATLRPAATALDARYRNARRLWLARLVRRATASLLDEPPLAGDAGAPFFVSAAPERWREALASIMALGPASKSGKPRDAGAPSDRLIWTVRVDAQQRIVDLAPLEQKVGARGLGKPKAVSLAALAKRKDLPAHDAALLRALRRSAWGAGVELDLGLAAPALVRHPYVAWSDAPEHFIEVVEALPALEVMTRGEHVAFRLVDPLLPEQGQGDDAGAADDDGDDDLRYLPAPLRQARGHARLTLLVPEGSERARLLRLTPAQLRVASLVAQGWQVPASARQELDAALRVLGSHFQLASDAEAGREVPASSVLRAELTPRGSGLAFRLLAAPFGDHGPRLAPGAGRERVTTVHEGATLFTRRHLAAERAHRAALVRSLDFLDDGAHAWDLDEPEQALALVEALAPLGASIVTEWPKGKALRVRTIAAPEVKLNVTTRGDWLMLDGELAFDDGEVLRLEALLELVERARGRYVALKEGDFLALGEGLRQQLADLGAVAQPHKDGRRVAGVAALAWSEQADALALHGDAAWRKRSAAWADARERSFAVPGALQAELRDYQHAGYTWLMRLAAAGFGACLADDMGLGKTLMTLAVLLARAPDGAALVVAPTSVCSNWLAEAARFAPALDVQLYGDIADAGEAEAIASAQGDAAAEPARSEQTAAARRRQVRALGRGQVLVCSYALLQLDADILAECAWYTAVLDEAQAIKNAATQRARAAARLEVAFRVTLSGTPIENRLGELWSIMGFANPGLLGSAEQFNRRFATPIERDGDNQAARRLRRLIAPFLLRRTKAEVLSDLPPRTEIVHEVVPSRRERALLEVLRREAETSIGQVMASGAAAGQARMHLFAALTRLRRAACDPRLVEPELGLVGAKVQEFERLAQEMAAGRHKALVFSQFTDFLGLLRERLDAAGLACQYLDGSTPAAERGKRVAAFQRGDGGDFFLISLKAGGFGLNLTVADYVIIADPWWNPAAEDQASGRAHRIGQQRPVTVYRLVTQGSIEERIVGLHRSKRALAEGILEGQDGGALPDAGELLALLRGEA